VPALHCARLWRAQNFKSFEPSRALGRRIPAVHEPLAPLDFAAQYLYQSISEPVRKVTPDAETGQAPPNVREHDAIND
jgi:hypothetical protein